MYTSAQAGRLVGMRPERVRRWLKGYKYAYRQCEEDEPCIVEQVPVIGRTDPESLSYTSFLELIDLVFIKQFLDFGFSLQKIRKALDEAEVIIGDRHFARESFFTDSKNIYLQVKDKGDAILQLMSSGQWAIPSVIEQTAKRIEFDQPSGFAKKWYHPLGIGDLIVLDPNIAFGAPSIVGCGIPTANIYDLYIAENKKIERVCSWMNIGEIETQAAIEFEEYLAAA